MNGIRRFAIASAAGLGLLGALAAAANPKALAVAEGGLWEIARTGEPPVRLCVVNPAALAQFEHRGARCNRAVVRDNGSAATIHYSCAAGGFGHSDVTVITPRSLRIETQGISANAPFKYTFQARRLGNCPAH